ncbi:hypothetical protein LCGC14_0418670 [marine sediment metagenome]|uniref:DedA family protein n=1 Tax=marine sediment metagenome TaxID=412755 RepID=A0A0F9SXI9_9ZZZZ|nr:DedA family protein [Phycisphaerae bacterium]HDZ42571.1 DedA family protein [Phycisphaerae bacterium]
MRIASDAEFCEHCGAKIGPHRHVPWWHVHRRLYDWTLAWAYRPSASVALFILSFTESIIFPVPPDVLLIPLTLSNRRRWAGYATNCTIASITGAIAAYLIGWLAWTFVEPYAFQWFAWAQFTPENFRKATGQFERYNFWIVFTAGFTPLPFKVFNVVAGTMGPKSPNPALFFTVFVIAATTSRGARFFLLTWLIRIYGAKITPFIDKYFNWLALVFAALLIGGFVVIKFVI